jgi:Ca2+-binding EF-hand superfamily protein
VYVTIAHVILPEFRTFVHETERELLSLFKSIDYNGDGKISKAELSAALSRAGLAVPSSNLDNFFTEVDSNNDGTISFEEWRCVYQRGCLALVQSTGSGKEGHRDLVVG